ncbi:hypothetical protein D8B26_000442 [Coccidioides posadasii str. Silveira]|uniref:Uncharacterized protein n=1 Tax=Coccidioides posadasii (strain RMSCC 757 / Silveira) TaxID=443226 RepID=E9DFQ2_COCPS|nr:conserved hypothetical protein [Coccidioides posadasii str. Silveira]QVM05733.1 hypothetical protein D8B26_000442 [Coccidioides posadasii str. Silveira]
MGYMSKPLVSSYYDALAERPTQQNAAHLWWSILHEYFDFHDGFGKRLDIEITHGTMAPYIAISRLEKGSLNTVILLHFVKPPATDSPRAQSEAWQDIWDLLAVDLNTVRAERPDTRKLYGIGTIGTCSRFYTFTPSYHLVRYGGAETLEIKDDEEKIEQYLVELIRDTSKEIRIPEPVRRCFKSFPMLNAI